MYRTHIRPLSLSLLLLLTQQTALADDPSAKTSIRDDFGIFRDVGGDIGYRQQQIERNDSLRRKNTDGAQEDDTPDLSDEDLKKNPEIANHILNTAMLREDWDTLEHIMGFYRDIPGHDPVMYDFVQGALWRAQGKHGKAIKTYRKILDKQPDLSYVRLDLAGMLFENRAYRDAAKEFGQVKKEDIEPEAAAQADAYLQAVKQANPWQFKLRGGLQYSSNTNNATSNDYFLWPFAVIDGVTYYYKLPRDPESLPRSGHGYSYGAQLQKDFNLSGNHNIGFNIEADGVHYPGRHEDNEFSLSADAGYKYQNLNNTFTLTPLVSASWLGGRPYSRSIGAAASASRWVTPRLQLSGSYSALRRKYRDERYEGYDSTANSLSLSSVYALTGNWFVFGGAAVQRENTRDKEETSTRRSLSLGTLYRFDNGINFRIGGRHVSRRFANPATLYGGDIRRDKEIYADASVWKEKWLPGGITPKLEFSYLKVKSNIYAFPRNKKQVLLTLEKEF
ncbi:hypothetical protein HMPREF9120_02660 [Neisseria sp. oral taxon 020 str. F0370]|uniref:surface lipoprotein assembly modifier n=1 Tax=unclassified Neisseria TaxID=2623750 RepID=UPI0002A24D16|nr:MULTISPECIES: surface lipoprotein assembly modifier [unclassified Neisseria]ASP16337.1 DUF560 domain-containing protein [Neisseria sp. KEM232]EKY03560.1 hypothetical protein HMPREF9120_02660 [Neisseria sp. oral taxon 020 str. F0370]